MESMGVGRRATQSRSIPGILYDFGSFFARLFFGLFVLFVFLSVVFVLFFFGFFFFPQLDARALGNTDSNTTG